MEPLLCHQDIHNVGHKYNIDAIKLHENDLQSVSLWVDSIEDQCEDNPVIVFKQYGKEQSGDLNDLSKDNFLVAIQTLFQRDMHA